MCVAQPGNVYLVGTLEGCYKIGRSNNPHLRTSSYAPLLPVELKVIHVIAAADPVWLESVLHTVFKGRREQGEWFRLTLDEVALFRSMNSVAVATDLPHEVLAIHLASSGGGSVATPTTDLTFPGRSGELTLGEFLKAKREAAGLTQVELSEKLGVTQGFVASLESGRKSVSSTKLLFGLLRVFRTTSVTVTCADFEKYLADPPASPARTSKPKGKK